MKELLVIISILTLPFSVLTQENIDTSKLNYEVFPDIEAEFPGGSIVMMKYITQNITYPDKVSQIDFYGKIYISFIVNIDGVISDVKVNQGIDKDLDEMVRKLILNMPKWKPAKKDGKIVRSQVRLPINIHLN